MAQDDDDDTANRFTLIELIVVVAIIGILVTIAPPGYQTYIASTQISRVMSETGGRKGAVDDCFSRGVITTGPGGCEGTASASTLLADGGNLLNGGAPPAGTGVPVLAFGPGNTATLTATFGNGATMVSHGSTLVWSRDGSGTWICTTNVPAAGLPVTPGRCRGRAVPALSARSARSCRPTSPSAARR